MKNIYNLKIIEDENLVANADRMGKYLLDQLRSLEVDHPIIGNVRGLGLLTCVLFGMGVQYWGDKYITVSGLDVNSWLLTNNSIPRNNGL